MTTFFFYVFCYYCLMTNGFSILHAHTIASDGKFTYQELIDMAKKYGVKTLAFTDHDMLVPGEVFKDLVSKNQDINLVSGIEVSANTVKEVEGTISVFHVIGLFVDPTNVDFQNYCKEAKEKRLERATRIVDGLTRNGFTISVDEVLMQTEDGNIGRPHVVQALFNHPQNMTRLDELMEEFRLAAEKNPELQFAYEEAVKDQPWGRVFRLILKNDSFIRGVYVPYLKMLSMDEAVSLIRNAGGIAILAHPSYYKEKITRELLELFAKEKRIDGIETVFAIPEENQIEGALFESFASDRKFAQEINEKYGLVGGGGGDVHVEADLKRMLLPHNQKFIEETSYFIEDIHTKFPHHSLAWSSFHKN